MHRPLIRATLPRPEGQVPERKAPDFTMRQGGKFDPNRNGRHRAGGFRRQARRRGRPSSGRARLDSAGSAVPARVRVAGRLVVSATAAAIVLPDRAAADAPVKDRSGSRATSRRWRWPQARSLGARSHAAVCRSAKPIRPPPQLSRRPTSYAKALTTVLLRDVPRSDLGPKQPRTTFSCMADFTGKHGLVVGVANKRSIAWAIAQVTATRGARLAITYQGRFEEHVARALAGARSRAAHPSVRRHVGLRHRRRVCAD